jgi:hypothetical protein
VIIGKRTHRNTQDRARRRPDPFQSHWSELLQCLEVDPDQTGLQLFSTLRAKYPDRYMPGQLRTLQRRLKIWRQEAVKRLICEMHDSTQDIGSRGGST